MSTRDGADGGRHSEGDDVAVRLLALGWALAAFAVGISAVWSLLCAICGNFNNPGGYLHGLRNLHDHGLLLLAIGPLVMSLLYVAGLGLATWIYRTRRRRGVSGSPGGDGPR